MFEVEYVPGLRADDDPKEVLYGETDGRGFKIRINSKYSVEVQRATLFHEAVHAALAVSGLTHLLKDEGAEEALVSCIEHAFCDVVQIEGLASSIDS